MRVIVGGAPELFQTRFSLRLRAGGTNLRKLRLFVGALSGFERLLRGLVTRADGVDLARQRRWIDVGCEAELLFFCGDGFCFAVAWSASGFARQHNACAVRAGC